MVNTLNSIRTIERHPGAFTPKHGYADFLLDWGRKLDAEGMILRGLKGDGFSFSHRFALGFVVTSREAEASRLDEDGLLLVEPREPGSEELHYRGNGSLPWETWIHAEVFRCRGGAIFSFFVRRDRPVESAGGIVVARLAEEVLSDAVRAVVELEAALGMGNVVQIGQRGVLSFGCTAEDAGEALLALVD